MFTGLVQTTARLTSLQPGPHPHPQHTRLVLDASHWTPDAGYQPAPGDSIAVAGVCLTLTDATLDRLSFDVVPETLKLTTLGNLAPGDRVNLEPALLPTQPIGGHFMQGHVDGIGQVRDIQADGETRITIMPPAELLDYIIPKGSIAIDGVSLTLAAVHRDAFEVALIPTTLERTTLADLAPGDNVNLEADILSKTLVHHLRRQISSSASNPDPQPVTWQTLREAGFLRYEPDTP